MIGSLLTLYVYLYERVDLVRKHSDQICVNVCMSVGAGRKYSSLICSMEGV